MLTIPMTPEIENQLRVEAQKKGLKTEEYALNAILKTLPPSSLVEKEKERLAAIDKFIGFAAELAPLRLSERVHRDRQEEAARDEAKFQAHIGKN